MRDKIKLRKIIFTYKTYAVIYIIVILIYAKFYQHFHGILSESNLSFLRSFYFSVITITTLGYGEIFPNSSLGMILVSSQVLIGIIIIGLFLNFLWKGFDLKIQQSQEDIIKKRIKKQNRQKLSSYYAIIKPVIEDYKLCLYELTTPKSERGKDYKLNEKFEFSNLRDLYDSSIFMDKALEKPIIHLYFDSLDLLISELKIVLLNFDMSDFPRLHQNILSFIKISRESNIREALYSYEHSLYKDAQGKKKPLKDLLKRMIEDFHGSPNESDLKKYESNLLLIVIVFYFSLKKIITYIKSIEECYLKLEIIDK